MTLHFRDHSTLINGVHTKYSRVRVQRYSCEEEVFKKEGTQCIRKSTVGYVKGLDAKQLFSYVLTTDILVRKLFMAFEWGGFCGNKARHIILFYFYTMK